MHVVDPPAAATADGFHTISIADDAYPPLLREIHDPPDLLYVRGNPAALLQPQIALVGARKASAVGIRLARQFGSELAMAGLSVCSGLALGIDGAGHRGALAADGTSVAVMATGIDRLYPSRHRDIAAALCQRGCLISELPPGTPPRKGNFPRRNRIISGLSLGVLVVEAALPSGTLITARTALEQGREVFALPWSLPHPVGRGCLHLLRDGAKMVQSVEDILEELGPLYALQREGINAASEEAREPDDSSGLLRWLGFDVVSVDELVERSGIPVSQVLRELSDLELSGRIVQAAGGYARC